MNRAGPAIVGVILALLVAGGAGLAYTLIQGGESGAYVVRDDAAAAGTITLEYRGVRVDVPADWERLDGSGCEYERWGPTGTDPCDPDTTGITFMGSVTLDLEKPAGTVSRVDGPNGKAFGGYVGVGDHAIYVNAPTKDVAEAVLASARETDPVTAP